MTARVLVTGGAGFIGSHLVAALLERGRAVTVLDDFSSGQRANLGELRGDLEVCAGSVCEPQDVGRAMRGVDRVAHLAAIPSVTRSVERPFDTHHACATGRAVHLAVVVK